MTLNNIQLLATIYTMRTNSQYQSAEFRRRRVNNIAAMVESESPEDSGAVHLLINTWETISTLVLELDDEDKDHIFASVPFTYMFTELNDAIEILGCKFPCYAANFRLVSKQQAAWLKFKDDRYQTGEQGGMHALFG
jgi:predicted oxidoreductase (fatty acid repression mutant protein)